MPAWPSRAIRPQGSDYLESYKFIRIHRATCRSEEFTSSASLSSGVYAFLFDMGHNVAVRGGFNLHLVLTLPVEKVWVQGLSFRN